MALHLCLESFKTRDFRAGTLPLHQTVSEGLLVVGFVLLKLLRVRRVGLRKDHDVMHHLLDLGLELGIVGRPSGLLLRRLLGLLRLLLLLGLLCRLALLSLLLLRLLHLLRILLSLSSCLLRLSALRRLRWPLLPLLRRSVGNRARCAVQLLHDLLTGTRDFLSSLISPCAPLGAVVVNVP